MQAAPSGSGACKQFAGVVHPKGAVGLPRGRAVHVLDLVSLEVAPEVGHAEIEITDAPGYLLQDQLLTVLPLDAELLVDLHACFLLKKAPSPFKAALHCWPGKTRTQSLLHQVSAWMNRSVTRHFTSRHERRPGARTSQKPSYLLDFTNFAFIMLIL
jgi:hypothetical protein